MFIYIYSHTVTPGYVQILSLSVARSTLILKRFLSCLNSVTSYYQKLCWCSTDVMQRKKAVGRGEKNGAKQNAWLHSNVSFEQKRSPAVSALKNKSWGKLINLDRQARLKKTSQDSSLLTTSKATDKPLKVRSRLRWCSLHFPLQLSR